MSSETNRASRWSEGDRVRVDIPDETDPDHRRFHGRHGRVIAIVPRCSSGEAEADPDRSKYRVEFDGGGYADLRWYDLRPPIVR